MIPSLPTNGSRASLSRPSVRLSARHKMHTRSYWVTLSFSKTRGIFGKRRGKGEARTSQNPAQWIGSPRGNPCLLFYAPDNGALKQSPPTIHPSMNTQTMRQHRLFVLPVGRERRRKEARLARSMLGDQREFSLSLSLSLLRRVVRETGGRRHLHANPTSVIAEL